MTSPRIESHTAARVAHRLGLGACFGGALFGKAVFNPSLGVIHSKTERGKLGATFWNRANAINTAAFVVAAATWLPERRHLMERNAGDLFPAKDVLMGVAGAAGLLTLIVQAVLYRQAPEGAVPLETGGKPAPEAPPRAFRLQQIVSALGTINAVLFASLVALTEIAARSPVR